MAVQFNDNSAQIIAALDDAVIAFLYEAGGELEAQVKRNTRVGTGQLKNSWMYIVDESKGEVTVGSMLENAIWEEFGTGEYALHGDGRKGGWWYKNPKAKYTKTGKLRKGSQEFIFTRGKTPHRALQKAIDSCKQKIINRAKKVIGGRLS